MEQKRLSEKFADLKVGDTVTVYYATGYYDAKDIKETTITKIGRGYIYTDSYKCEKFDKKNGSGAYGWHIFPGTEYELKLWINSRIFGKDVLHRFQMRWVQLTQEELMTINDILIK